MRWRHREEYDKTTLLAANKVKGKVWSNAYKHLFAQAEARLIVGGVRNPTDIIDALNRQYPEIDRENLKYRRKGVHGHPNLVREYVQKMTLNENRSESVAEIPAEADEHTSEEDTWTRRFRDCYYFSPEDPIRCEEMEMGIKTDPQSVDEYVGRWLQENLGMEIPDVMERRNTTRRKGPTPAKGRAARKRQEYKLTQDLYTKNKSKCFSEILNGTLGTTHNVDLDELNSFWEQLFQKEPPPCGVEVRDQRETNHDLWRPISREEVHEALKGLKNSSAPGLDGITPSRIKQVPIDQILLLFNLFLGSAHTPGWMRVGRVTLVPKKPNPSSPGEFRPITVTSVLLRLYHKVIGKRLDQIEINHSQKGFRRRDGIAENTWLLKQIIKRASRKPANLHLAFIDVAKAFDSLTHEALLICLKRVGVPPPLLKYIAKLYSEAKLVIGDSDRSIHQTCGILQGDPLSGAIFNFALDWAYNGLDPNLGVRVGDQVITDMLFADDGILLTESRRATQAQMKILERRLGDLGLRLNPKKCATLSIAADKKRKKAAVEGKSYLRIHGELVPSLDNQDRYKYLGLLVNGRGFATEAGVKLQLKCDRITAAKLKPQQRVEVLRHSVVPAMYHSLVLGGYTLGGLRALDVTIRKAMRKWLHLPMDTPLGYFYSETGQGGLGVSELGTTVPMLARQRVGRLKFTSDKRIQAINREVLVQQEYTRLERSCVQKRRYVGTKDAVNRLWKESLHSSVDGRGLRDASKIWNQHQWIKDPSYRITGAEFVKAMRMRAGVVDTPARRARRSGNSSDAICSRDRQRATANHIAQVCQTTHGLRVKRHNAMVEMIHRSLERIGWTVEIEPRIRKGGTYLKPDIVAVKDNRYLVLDPIVTSTSSEMDIVSGTKSTLYDVPEIHAHARNLLEQVRGTNLQDEEEPEGEIHGITINNRGIFCLPGYLALREAGIPIRFLNLISLRVLVKTYEILRAYNTATG